VNNVDVSYFVLYLFLDDSLMTSTFDNYLLYYRCCIYLWYCCMMFLLLSLNSIILVKSSVAVFSLRRGKCFPGGRVLEGHRWDGAPWDQLLVN
jgi:hypothetical protein